MINELVRYLIIASVGLLITSVNAATIYISKAGRIELNGEIQRGDFEKFKRTVKENQDVVVLYLNSPGGYLSEAIKIGELVRDLGLATEARDGSICASACFFIWIHGNPRGASYRRYDKSESNIGLHRPYKSNPTIDQKSLEEQKKAQKLAANYLEENFIPRKLIDVMMSRSSNEIYWIKDGDLDELGEYTHAVQELLIAKCAYDAKLTTKLQIAQNQRLADEIRRIKEMQDKVSTCIAEVLVNLYSRSRERFFIIG